MNKEITYPKNYELLRELNVCSNRIIGGGSIIGIDSFAPLLIGNGQVPAIWLYVRIDKSNWTAVIKESESFHPKVLVTKNVKEREIIIKIENIIVLQARMTSDKICEIETIDLRPIGFNIYGSNNNFQVANSSFSGNTFNGISFMVGFGEKEEQ